MCPGSGTISFIDGVGLLVDYYSHTIVEKSQFLICILLSFCYEMLERKTTLNILRCDAVYQSALKCLTSFKIDSVFHMAKITGRICTYPLE